MPPISNNLAPLDPNKTRALTTIYAPRKLKPRKNKTAQSRMLEDVPIKPSISPFHPLPAIGHTEEKVIVLDLNARDGKVRRLHDASEPLPPPSSLQGIRGYRKKSLEPLKKPIGSIEPPQHLIRENTYDVIEPVFVKVNKRNRTWSRQSTEKVEGKLSATPEEKEPESETKVSPKTRFKQAALQVVKLSSMPETGKLLCLRERQTFNYCKEGKKECTLQEIPRSPTQKLSKLSEIFQCLDTQGRYKERMKKDNSWF